MRHRIGVRSILAVGLLAASADASSATSTGASGNVTVALVSEQTAVQPGRPFYVGLRMKMRKGWHTYWKNPGDAGLPLQIEWKLPEGFSAGPIEWPVPERIPEGPLVSYGYGREVLLPIRITPPGRVVADSATIEGVFDWLECKDVCLPGSATLTLSLPVRPEPPVSGPDAPSFAEARSRMPRPSKGWTFSAEAGSRAISLALRPPPGSSPRRGYLFVDQPLVLEYAAPQGFERVEGGYRLTAPPDSNASGPPERLTGVLVIEDRAWGRGWTALQVDVPVSSGDPSPARGVSRRGWLPTAAYGAAFGLLLALLLRALRRPLRR